MKIRPTLSIKSKPMLLAVRTTQLRIVRVRQVRVELLTVIADRRVPQREETDLPPHGARIIGEITLRVG